jgi:hypothetical protein
MQTSTIFVASPIAGSCWSESFRRLAAASFILAAVYFWFPSLMIGRGVFLIAARIRHRLCHQLADRVRVASASRRPA